jgi:hypothetical protein
MSAWRRKAIELFPDLRSEVEDPDATIYSVFFALLPRCREAHDRDDTSELEKIYGFAEWCASQKAKDLWNSAGVAFYEHLFDEPSPDYSWFLGIGRIICISCSSRAIRM